MNYLGCFSTTVSAMGSQHGTKNDSKHSRRNAKDNGNKVLATLDSPGDPKQGRKNNWHPRKDPETTESEGIISPAERLKSLSAGSHSSSDYSSEDFIQVDPKVNKSKGSDIESPNDVRPLPRYHNIDVSSSDMSSKSEHDSGSSTGGTSQISDLTHESLSHTTSLTESPPIQVMERPAGFDPNRIPSSIFASKSPSPMEWSVASNESLFSIRIGNNSFSRDHVHKLPGDLPNAEESNKSSESSIFNPRLPGVREMESDRNDVNMGRNFGERVAAATHKTKKDALIATANDQSREMLQDQELSFNHHLDGGTSNFQTFAIPKKEKHVGSSWCCSNCSCGSCCCIRLSCCSCKWPLCNCWKWPSCGCCKWSSCRCCKWPSCRCCKRSSCCSCKWLSCSGCRWPSCSSCKWPSCRCCKWPSCRCCKWPSCRCCSCPSCSSCTSCSCCSWPSCSCCKGPSCCKSCKWPSCNCCKWPSCSCFKWKNCCCCCTLPTCSGCNWALCCG